MSECVPVSPENKERTMHTITQRRMIRETAQEQKYEEPPGLAHSPPGGQYLFYEVAEKYDEESMTAKENRTEWA
eukprot:963383-Amphidinium_carterae.1